MFHRYSTAECSAPVFRVSVIRSDELQVTRRHYRTKFDQFISGFAQNAKIVLGDTGRAHRLKATDIPSPHPLHSGAGMQTTEWPNITIFLTTPSQTHMAVVLGNPPFENTRLIYSKVFSVQTLRTGLSSCLSSSSISVFGMTRVVVE